MAAWGRADCERLERGPVSILGGGLRLGWTEFSDDDTPCAALTLERDDDPAVLEESLMQAISNDPYKRDFIERLEEAFELNDDPSIASVKCYICDEVIRCAKELSQNPLAKHFGDDGMLHEPGVSYVDAVTVPTPLKTELNRMEMTILCKLDPSITEADAWRLGIRYKIGALAGRYARLKGG